MPTVKHVAVLNDVHGNLPALEAVLAELDDDPVDAVVCGGDVLWGAYQAECIALLRDRGARFLTGNCERSVQLDVDGLGRVLLCHGSPRSDEEILTVATPDETAAEAIAGIDADLVVIGHTHHQFDRRVEGTRLVNAGSVGLPYEGRAGAYGALLGPDVELRRTEYDVAAAADRLRASGMPGIDDLLPESLLEPAPSDELVAHFERQAGRGESS